MSPTEDNSIKGISIIASIAIFTGGALLFVLIERAIIPFLNGIGTSKPILFLMLALPHMLFFFLALLGYRLEGNRFERKSFLKRFRYKSIKGKMWIWTILIAIINILLYMAVYTLAGPIVEKLYSWCPPPKILDDIMGNGEMFAGHVLKGNWWLLGLFFIVYFFNILGEEFLWRGYLFPKQEKTHGKYTWIVHGLLWTSFHLFAPYNALIVFPGAMFMSYVVQRTKNNTIFLIAHATLNGIPLVILISHIVG